MKHENDNLTKQEIIEKLMLLHEEFEKTRPTFFDQQLKLADYFRMKAKVVQLRYQRKCHSEQKPDSIIKRIIHFLGFSNR